MTPRRPLLAMGSFLFALLGAQFLNAADADQHQVVQVIQSKDAWLFDVLITVEGVSHTFPKIDSVRTALLDPTKKYLLVTSGTSNVGTIRFFRISDQTLVLEEYYFGGEPEWKDSSVLYSSVLWMGADYVITELHTFTNGKLERGSQSSFQNQDLGGEWKQALSPEYRLGQYELLGGLIRNFKSELEQMLQLPKAYTVDLASRQVFRFSGLTKPNLVDLAEGTKRASAELSLDQERRMNASDLFCAIYPIMDRAYEQKLLTKEEFNTWTSDYLSILDIQKTAVPWLLK